MWKPINELEILSDNCPYVSAILYYLYVSCFPIRFSVPWGIAIPEFASFMIFLTYQLFYQLYPLFCLLLRVNPSVMFENQSHPYFFVVFNNIWLLEINWWINVFKSVLSLACPFWWFFLYLLIAGDRTYSQ